MVAILIVTMVLVAVGIVAAAVIVYVKCVGNSNPNIQPKLHCFT